MGVAGSIRCHPSEAQPREKHKPVPFFESDMWSRARWIWEAFLKSFKLSDKPCQIIIGIRHMDKRCNLGVFGNIEISWLHPDGCFSCLFVYFWFMGINQQGQKSVSWLNHCLNTLFSLDFKHSRPHIALHAFRPIGVVCCLSFWQDHEMWSRKVCFNKIHRFDGLLDT